MSVFEPYSKGESYVASLGEIKQLATLSSGMQPVTCMGSNNHLHHTELSGFTGMASLQNVFM